MARPVGEERLGAGPPTVASPALFANDVVEGVRKFVCEALIEKEFHR